MTVKNAEEWIDECIASIIRQSFKDWELIMINDHSTDRSWTMMKQYQQVDFRIRVFQNKGTGITDALERALKESSGEFITRMDADDIMPDDKLLLLCKAAKNNPGTVVTGKVKYFSEKEISEGYLSYQEWLNERVSKNDFYAHVYRECILASPNWMTSRKVLSKVQSFRYHHYPEDYDLVFRWLEKEIPIVGIDHCTHLWREHVGRTSRRDQRYSQSSFFTLKLQWFLKLEEVSDREIVLFGKNRKEKLCRTFFEKSGYRTTTLTLQNVQELSNFRNPLVLVCVYPSPSERLKIEAFLTASSRAHHLNWWYV